MSTQVRGMCVGRGATWLAKADVHMTVHPDPGLAPKGTWKLIACNQPGNPRSGGSLDLSMRPTSPTKPPLPREETQ